MTLIKQASEDMVLQELSFNVLKLNIPNFQNPLINNIEWQHYKSVKTYVLNLRANFPPKKQFE